MTDHKHEVRDYNDGQIHGWNGGDCPVHPETVVKYWTCFGVHIKDKAKNLRWAHSDETYDIIAFKVVKPYVEPKVIWVNEYPEEFCFNGIAYFTEQGAKISGSDKATRIAVKYVEVKE